MKDEIMLSKDNQFKSMDQQKCLNSSNSIYILI